MLVSYGGKPLSTRLKLRLRTKANKTLNCSQKKREDPHFCESSLCRDAKASLCVIFLFIRRYVFSGCKGMANFWHVQYLKLTISYSSACAIHHTQTGYSP